MLARCFNLPHLCATSSCLLILNSRSSFLVHDINGAYLSSSSNSRRNSHKWSVLLIRPSFRFSLVSVCALGSVEQGIQTSWATPYIRYALRLRHKTFISRVSPAFYSLRPIDLSTLSVSPHYWNACYTVLIYTYCNMIPVYQFRGAFVGFWIRVRMNHSAQRIIINEPKLGVTACEKYRQ